MRFVRIEPIRPRRRDGRSISSSPPSAVKNKMLSGLRGDSPVSEGRADRALISTTPVHSYSPPSNTNSAGYLAMSSGSEVHGRKTFAFWTLVCLLLLLAAGNLALTFTILGVLHLGQGMESLELVPEASAIKFFGSADLDHVYKRDGQLQGFSGAPVTVSSDGGSVILALAGPRGSDPKMKVNATHTIFRGIKELRVTDPTTGRVVFSNQDSQINMADGTKQLNAKMVSTNRVSSPIDQDLHIRSDSTASLSGAEGARLDAEHIMWSADQDVTLRSVNGSVYIGGREGVYIDVKGIPIAREDKSGVGGASGVTQYKLCVCMPQGKLFRVPVVKSSMGTVTCSHVNMSPAYNPCL